MTEVGSLVLSGLVGAAAAYVLDIRKAQAERKAVLAEKERERRRNRETIATTLLFDLKRLEFELRQLFESKSPSRAAVRHPDLFYDTLRAETRWFASSSIQPIAQFFCEAEFVFTTLELMQKAGLGGTHDAQREYHLRCLCGFALQKLPAAAMALISEGGVSPDSQPYPLVTFPELPEVPQRMFPDNPPAVPTEPGRP